MTPGFLDCGFLGTGKQKLGEASLWICAVPQWTILSFWDRTHDKRYGCCSSFVLKGALNFEDALAAAQEAFPQVFDKIGFEIKMRVS